MIARFSRAGYDDATVEVEVEDIVFDHASVEDATTGVTIAAIGERFGGQRVFLPVNTPTHGWYDTVTVVAKGGGSGSTGNPPLVARTRELIEALDGYNALDSIQIRLIEAWAAGKDVNDVRKFTEGDT